MLYNFIIKNLTLSVILLTSITILIIFELNEFIQSKNSINPEKAIDLINHQNAIIIDIRNENEFKQCHVINSVNIPYNKLITYKNILKKYKKKIIIIMHNKNNLAQKAIKQLKNNELNEILYINDGINAWNKNNLPTNKK